MPTLSHKVKVLPNSPIRKLVRYADTAKSNGIEVLHLNIGQPDIPAPKEALEATQNHSLDLLSYGVSQGSFSYREKLCAYYKKHSIAIEPQDILVTTGASEALVFILNTVCDAGDEIIVPEPFYANYSGFAEAAGAVVIPVVSCFEDNFKLPPIATIEAKINAKTRAILLCNPNNPTGYVYTQQEVEALGNMAVKHDVFLIVDEVYREFIYEPHITHYSVLKNEAWQDHAVLIDSVSKRYSLCGARVGCIISKNKSLIRHLLKFAHLRLSPPALGLAASEGALSAPDTYLKNAIAEYTHRRDVLMAALKKILGIRVSCPTGAFYCIVKLPVSDAEDFSRFLLSDFSEGGQTVMLAPLAGFYATPGYGRDEVRIAFILEAAKLERAAFILEKALQQYGSL